MNNKGIINNKIYEIMTEEEYGKQKNMFTPTDDIAIHRDGLLYPINRNGDESKPGVYDKSAFLKYVEPAIEDRGNYSDSNMIDFNNANSISDVIDKQNKLTNQERTILTNPDNITIPVIKDSDSPEMVLFKEAIIAKNIDIDKYEHRFGNNFMNNKRILTRDSITLNKLIEMCNGLDIEVSLTLKDTNPDIPNPMGVEINGVLTGGIDNESETNNY